MPRRGRSSKYLDSCTPRVGSCNDVSTHSPSSPLPSSPPTSIRLTRSTKCKSKTSYIPPPPPLSPSPPSSSARSKIMKRVTRSSKRSTVHSPRPPPLSPPPIHHSPPRSLPRSPPLLSLPRSPSPPPRSSPLTLHLSPSLVLEKIAGTRMSSVKHSGLLANDRRTTPQSKEEEDILTIGPWTPSLRATKIGGRTKKWGEVEAEEEEGKEVENVLGKEIFGIQHLGRSSQKRKKQSNGLIAGVSHFTADAKDRRKEMSESSREDTEEPLSLGKKRKDFEREREKQRRKERERQMEEREKKRKKEVDEQRKKEMERKREEDRKREEREREKKSQERHSSGGIGRSLRKRRKRTSFYLCRNSDDETTEEEKTEKEKVKKKPNEVEEEMEVEEKAEDSEDEEEGDEELASIAAQLNTEAGNDPLGRHMVMDYFTSHSDRAGTTSDHTLSRLACPRPDQQVVQTALKTAPIAFEKDCQFLFSQHRMLFPYWLLQMSAGFNILLYGLGSKKKIIEAFCSRCLSSSCRLVINGFFPGLSAKQILSTLSSELLGCLRTFRSLVEQAEFICSNLATHAGSTAPTEVFLVMHSLDGPTLRNEKAQQALSILATSPHIHVVASVDHINAPLLWDQARLARFNWAWHDVTTFDPYREETSYENSLLLQQSGSLGLSSLTHVMSSLTPNAKGLFQLLANYQLEHQQTGGAGGAGRGGEGGRGGGGKAGGSRGGGGGEGGGENNYLGLSFSECYRRCREQFLVNSEHTLRAQLTEFIDHKLIRSSRGGDGVEYLTIPVDHATLSQFMEENFTEF